MALSKLLFQFILLGPSGMMFLGISCLILGDMITWNWLIFGIIGCFVSGILSIIVAVILFVPVNIHLEKGLQYLSVSDIYFRYLPVLSLPVMLFIIIMYLQTDFPNTFLQGFLHSVYLNFLLGWYFMSNYLSQVNNAQLK